MSHLDPKNDNNLRVIRTARTEKEINEAAKKGFHPVVKEVRPSPKIRSKFAVLQDPESGEIKVIYDYRQGMTKPKVIDWTSYYPHQFPAPFAAYLVPPDLQPGEKVFLEDLIEDMVSAIWNQGSTYRLNACEARWNGSDFEILFDPQQNVSTLIG